MDIKQILLERLRGLTEAAKTVSDLPESAGLYLPESNFLILYDKQSNHLYGMINIFKSKKYYYVGAVAAEQGYGPLMYELAMAYISPNALMADRDSHTSASAENIWKYMMGRNDVEKIPIPKGDEEYAKQYEGIPHLQTAFIYKNKGEFNALRGKAKENPLNRKEMGILKDRADDYFYEKL
jgi:hypothetical protein